MTNVLTRMSEALVTRASIVQRLLALRADHEAAHAERAKAIATAQLEVDQLEEPRRRLERLQQEAFSAGLREGQAVAALESQLRDRWPRELQRFADMVERVYALLRQGVHA